MPGAVSATSFCNAKAGHTPRGHTVFSSEPTSMRFRNLHALFKWAYGHREAVQPSSIYRMAKDKGGEKKKRTTETLSLWDRLAQQGMIQSYVGRLSPDMSNHLLAFYTKGKARIRAQNDLVNFVLPRLPTGVHKRAVIYELVAKYYGKPVDFNELANRLEEDEFERRRLAFEIARYWGYVKSILDGCQQRATVYAEDHYVDAGLIERDA